MKNPKNRLIFVKIQVFVWKKFEKIFWLISIQKRMKTSERWVNYPWNWSVLWVQKLFFWMPRHENPKKTTHFSENSSFCLEKILIDFNSKTDESIWKLSKFSMKLAGLMDTKIVFSNAPAWETQKIDSSSWKFNFLFGKNSKKYSGWFQFGNGWGHLKDE